MATQLHLAAGFQPTTEYPDMQAYSLDLAMHSARCLARLVRPDGRFIYRYDPTLRTEMPGYNILRHAGCIWAMNFAAAVQPDPDLSSAARRAMDWLTSTMLAPSDQRGIAGAERGRIKLGANALTILALLSFLDSDSAELDLVSGLCEHIWAQQRDDGDFMHIRRIGTDEPEPFRSEYYTGEALFALLLAAERLRDSGQLRRCKTSLDYLVANAYGIEQQSHWMMYAVETRHRIDPDVKLPVYAERLVDNILERPFYRRAERCTPIACRSEALQAYLRMVPCGVERRRARATHAWKAVEQNLHL